MNQPITSFFSSQSTEGEKNVPKEGHDDGDVMVAFAEIQFDLEEDNMPDHMVMSRKQFEILNYKLNSLLQIQTDTGGRNTVSGIGVDLLLKSQENRLMPAMEQIKSKHEERLKHHVKSFQYEVKELRAVAKEHHLLFVEEVKKV